MKPSEALAALVWQMRVDSTKELLAICERWEDGSYTIPAKLGLWIEQNAKLPYHELPEPEKAPCRDCAVQIQKLYLGEEE